MRTRFRFCGVIMLGLAQLALLGCQTPDPIRVSLRGWDQPILVSPIKRIGDATRQETFSEVISSFSGSAKIEIISAGGCSDRSTGSGWVETTCGSSRSESFKSNIEQEMAEAVAYHPDTVIVLDRLGAASWAHASLFVLSQESIGVRGRVVPLSAFAKGAVQ